MRENNSLFKSCYLPLIWVMTLMHQHRATARRDNCGAAAVLMLTLNLMKITFICRGFWAAVTVPGRHASWESFWPCAEVKVPWQLCDDGKLCLQLDVRADAWISITKGTSWPTFTGEIAEITKLAECYSSEPPTFDPSLSSVLIT